MRQRVLVQAFACCPPGTEPFEGGEDLLGWMLIRQLARRYELWVLTHPKRRSGIEAHLRELPAGAVQFCYVRLPGWWEWCLRIPGLHQLYYYLWQFAAWGRARRLHQDLRFALFHHLTYANDWMGNVIGAFMDVPYVRGPGGGAQRVPPAFLKEFSWAGRVAQILRGIGQWLFRHDPLFLISQARASTILVCSQEALEAVPRHWRAKVRLSPVNGVSEEDLEFLAAPQASEPTRFCLLSVGKLLRLKGFPLVLKAFRLIADQEPSATLEIMGDGPDRTALDRLIQTLGIQDRVLLRPWGPRPQVLAALRACDVFVFASLRDGGGAVVVEALAAGKPAVCLRLGGPALHIDPSCGILVEAREPSQAVHDLAGAVLRLRQDPSLRAAMGQAARERAESTYRWEVLGDCLSQVYDAALNGGAPVSASVDVYEPISV